MDGTGHRALLPRAGRRGAPARPVTGQRRSAGGAVIRWATVSCVVASALLALHAAAAPRSSLDCGTASLAAFAKLVGAPIPRDRLSAISRAMPDAGPSMLDVKQAAEAQGIALKGIGAGLEEAAGFGGPAIIHLSEPDHFVVLARLSGEWAQVVDSGAVVAVPRAELEKRYSGHALVLADDRPRDGGRVQIEEFHYALGVSGVGQTVEHTFAVTNAGNGVLMVEPENCKTCGAPETLVAQEVLAPGKSTAVTVKFPVTSSGNVMRLAKLRTNDPRAAIVYLTLRGSVPHDVQVQPTRLHVSRDKNAVALLSVTVSGPADMNLIEPSCERGLFDVRLAAPEVDANEKQTWQLELGFKPQDFVGRIEDQLAVRTTHRDRPLITVPITGEVRGDADIRPAQVFFGFVTAGDKAEQVVAITSRSGSAFGVNSAKLERKGLRVTQPIQTDDGSWRVTATLTAEQLGVIDTELVLTTDVPGEETLEIPVYAHVLAAE